MEPAHVLGPLTVDHVQSALETHGTLYGAFLQNWVELAEFELATQFDARAESSDRASDDSLGGSFTAYVRHLQNFVGAHAVLTEYTNTLGSEWFDEEQAERYSEMAADLDVVPMAAFLSDLPACLVAVGPASLVDAATTGEDAQSGRETAGCRLSRDRLTAWDGWSDDARRALAEFDAAVSVSSVVEPYLTAQSTLHAHLFELAEAQLSEPDEQRLSPADAWATTD